MQVLRTKRQPRREMFFVLVADDGEQPVFVDVSGHLGKTMPFRKPAATCGVRVSPDVVAFSLLWLTKRGAKKMTEVELTMPRSVLSRLERRSPRLNLAPGQVRVEILLPAGDVPEASDTDALAALLGDDQDRPGRPELTTVTWDFTLDRDDAGIVDVEPADNATGTVDLPRGAVKASVYLQSEVAGRTLAISFIGHLPGRPGQAETPARVVAQILNLMTQLTEFRFLSGVEGARVPARPTGVWIAATTPRVMVTMPVALFANTSDATPTASGTVEVEVDLANARDRLLVHLRPSANIAELFEAGYRGVATTYVTNTFDSALGADAVRTAVTEILLGEVSDGTVELLNDAALRLRNGAFFTTSAAAPMPPA